MWQWGKKVVPVFASSVPIILTQAVTLFRYLSDFTDYVSHGFCSVKASTVSGYQGAPNNPQIHDPEDGNCKVY
jgi:hypothetical protein